jgi:hypothetical protein
VTLALGRRCALAVSASAVAGLWIGAAADRWAPPPAADTQKGTEEAFVEGLHWRELAPRKPPLRWTHPRALVTFRHLPPGPATLEVEVRYHGSPVIVTANGVRVAEIGRGERGGSYPLTSLVRPTLQVELRTAGRSDSLGRGLGTQLFRVALHHAPSRRPTTALLASFALVGACGAALAATGGVAPLAAGAIGVALAGLLAGGLVPHGLLRSAYAQELAVLMVALCALAGLLARLAERAVPRSGAWAFAAVLLAGLVQGIAAASPVMVTSDAYFHANNLLRVSRGDLFLTSITPHERPFRIPYGVSFYALLLPFLRTGVEPVLLVRWGAAVSALTASLALYFLVSLKRSARVAGLAVIVLQLLPASFVYFSEGTLSNVFGQSMTVLFFVWWAAGGPLGAPLGALLLGLGCLAHLSSLITLSLLCALLVALRPREAPLGRAKAWALGVAFAAAALYYGSFARLIADQVPRLLEGAGEHGARPSFLAALAGQWRGVVAGWGLPALALGWLGRPRTLADRLDRELAAFWLSGAVLLVAALVSPLETRYVYALTPVVAVAAAQGLLMLWEGRGGRRLAAVALLMLQAALAARGLVEALLYRYRP